MSFDGVVTRAIVKELQDNLVGGRVDKIYQPEKDELTISIHAMGKNQKLLISVNNNYPRIHLTEYNKKNPQKPPMFCMLLRKHLQGGIILDIQQYSNDRIIFIDVSSLNELGEKKTMRLIVEIMGRHSNIILVDLDNNKILDSIIRITEDISSIRQLLPGLPYNFPPLQNKFNPVEENFNTFKTAFKNENQNTMIFKFFYFNYLGFSPLIGREICYRANVEPNRPISSINDYEFESLFQEFKSIVLNIKNHNYQPNYVEDDNNEIIGFYCLELKQYSGLYRRFSDSISKVVDYAFYKKDNLNRIKQKSQNIYRKINVLLDRSKNKLRKQKEEYNNSKKREKYRVYGDVLSANFHKLKPGQKEVTLLNFYDEKQGYITIPLNKKKSGPQNADYFYKQYSRLKNAEKLLSQRIPNTKHEINYFEQVLLMIDQSESLEELEEINEELIYEGYIQDKTKVLKKKTKNKSLPHHFVSSDGLDIFVGRNNRQNDEVTLKIANRDDLWFHVQKMPGSHVIIRNSSNNIPESTIEEAAILAAYYSQGRKGKNIPVDYTYKKNVRKPKGAKPGMVFYNDFQTIFVNPLKSIVESIEKK